MLKILTLNVGFNVMGDVVSGSEANQVVLCQNRYGKNLNSDMPAQCTLNSIPIIVEHDLIGLQEVNITNDTAYNNYIHIMYNEGLKRGKLYDFYLQPYLENKVGLLIVADRNNLGSGISLSSLDIGLFDPDQGDDNTRGFQMIYFPVLNTLVVNLHAPHHINLKKSIWWAFKRSNKHLLKLGLRDKDIKDLIMMGDFNDHQQELVKDDFILDLYDLRLKMFPYIDIEQIPKTCCKDSDYAYRGDYIFHASKVGRIITDLGLPLNYDRVKTPISDHDPISVTISNSNK